MTSVRLEPAASRSRVKHSTTESLRSLIGILKVLKLKFLKFRLFEILNFHPCICDIGITTCIRGLLYSLGGDVTKTRTCMFNRLVIKTKKKQNVFASRSKQPNFNNFDLQVLLLRYRHTMVF